ncbi:glycosyltransferase family protein [Adhaeribacter pallidiroseus]|uniref:Glycosyltransferase subfamily 4-like N-terminal domain-containing protein n=1 Tax=Adhaeribacter pallidiroseus TaxID=2072847 RepID=A0A369QL23_9BACT|nr:hypothetical protein [Adhaeribacter pallidiroseus]RDC62968.1 hypothetical protein AHMF7616_01567 [Adhaeribacter pallidiroseus]
MKKTILVIASAPLHNGPRMIREIEALKPFYNIVAIGATPPPDASIKYYAVKTIDKPFPDKVFTKVYQIFTGKRYLLPLWLTKRRFQKLLYLIKPDFVIAHDPTHLPYLVDFPKTLFKLIYNAHEYHPLEFDENTKWLNFWGKYYYQLYKNTLPKVNLLINVCESIAIKCKEEFNKSSIVIPNAAVYYPDLNPVLNNYASLIRLIHHGIANKTRKIELMIDAVKMLGNSFHLDLMLVPVDPLYYEELQVYSRNLSNIRFIKPVAYNQIVPFINTYDIGLYNLPPVSFNNRIALPNKFYEFIQARLCLVVSPSVEMKKIVEEHDLGLVSDDYTAESLVETIKRLDLTAINRYKQNVHKAAYCLSAQQYQNRLVDALKEI